MADKTLISQYDGTHVKVGDALVRVDRGGAVPPGADPDHVQVLIDRGMVKEGKVVGGVTGAPDPETPPPFPLPASSQSGSSDEDGAPAGNASRDEWAAFALTQDGVSEDDVKDLSRDELRERFGTKQ